MTLHTSPALPQRVICHHIRRLIQACGGVIEAGSVVGLSKSQMSNFQNPNMEASPRLDQILALEAWCGEPIVTAALAAAQGLEGLDCDDRPSLPQQAIDLTGLMATLASTVNVALADGELTVTEADEIQNLRSVLDDALKSFDARQRRVVRHPSNPAAKAPSR